MVLGGGSAPGTDPFEQYPMTSRDPLFDAHVKSNRQLEHIEKDIAEAKALLASLETEKKELLSHTKVECTLDNYGRGCGAKHEIRDLVYIQTHWYVQPHGCTGGDYWNEGEGNWVCPSCSKRNRLFDGIRSNTSHINKLKHQFKSVVKEYKD